MNSSGRRLAVIDVPLSLQRTVGDRGTKNHFNSGSMGFFSSFSSLLKYHLTSSEKPSLTILAIALCTHLPSGFVPLACFVFLWQSFLLLIIIFIIYFCNYMVCGKTCPRHKNTVDRIFEWDSKSVKNNKGNR